jgi:hypothetical protein
MIDDGREQPINTRCEQAGSVVWSQLLATPTARARQGLLPGPFDRNGQFKAYLMHLLSAARVWAL